MNTKSETAPAVFGRMEGLHVHYRGVDIQMEMMQLPGWGELMTKVLPLLHSTETVPVQLRDLYRF